MNIGAGWIREKDGKKYLSCVVQTPGLELNFAMFKNEKKESEKQPDYQIVWSPPRAKKQENQPSGDNPFSDDDIPF